MPSTHLRAQREPAMSPRKKSKKLRVILACHEELVPPDSIEGLSDEEISDWRTEFDVLSTCKDLGHDTHVLGLADDIDPLRRACEEYRPDVVFNMLVEFHGAANYDQHVASYLELHRQNYTGCNPRGLTLARDKALSKKILSWHGLPVPDFAVFPLGRRVKRPAGLEFPLFVKSLNEEASLGISLESIVHDDDQLRNRVAHIHEEVGTDAIAEDYIEGREFYVGVIGNERVEAFPVWELGLSGLPPGTPRIATRKVKWDIRYQREMGIQNHRADLPEKLEKAVRSAAKKVYRALDLSGYARLDLRMRKDGRFYFLEANPNPDLTFGEDFAESAEAGGLGYEHLIQRILDLGRRYRAEWKSA